MPTDSVIYCCWLRADESGLHVGQFVKVRKGAQGLRACQAAVGGHIEAVYPAHERPDDLLAFANEDGLAQALPKNRVASLVFGHRIVGDVLLYDGVDDDGELVGFTPERRAMVQQELFAAGLNVMVPDGVIPQCDRPTVVRMTESGCAPGTKRYDEDGMRLTNCCGNHSTYSDDVLCCKACWKEVQVGEGDGNEYRPTTA